MVMAYDRIKGKLLSQHIKPPHDLKFTFNMLYFNM